MLLGILGASLLGNLLTSKGVMIAGGEGTITGLVNIFNATLSFNYF